MAGRRASREKEGKALDVDDSAGSRGITLTQDEDPSYHASNVPPGWSVFAQPDHSNNSSRLTFVSPSGIKQRSLKEVQQFITETKNAPRIPVKGAVIEAEMEDEHEKRTEWVQGTIIKVVPKTSSFRVNFKVENSLERGIWEETYKMSDEGAEWRWPQLSIDDFRKSAQQAVEACRKAMSQMAQGKMTRDGKEIKDEPEDEGGQRRHSKSPAAHSHNCDVSLPANRAGGGKAKLTVDAEGGDICKILGLEFTVRQLLEAIGALNTNIDEKTPTETIKRLADALGVTQGKTGMGQSRINYSVRRTILRVLPLCVEGDGERKSQGQGAGKSPGIAPMPRAGDALSRRGVEGKVPADMEGFLKSVHVGTLIEAEMDDTKGGTEWVVGQVQSLNAARATFTVKFKVQNETETGEWIDEYHWEELGREWRFSKVPKKKERDAETGGTRNAGQGKNSGEDDGTCSKSSRAGSKLLSHHLKGVPGAEVVEARHKAPPPQKTLIEKNSVDGMSWDATDAAMLKVGSTIEAEMDDSNGGTEWIRGVVQSLKNTANSFTVKFKVKNDDESGEWTEEYRLDELGKEWRFPKSGSNIHAAPRRNSENSSSSGKGASAPRAPRASAPRAEASHDASNTFNAHNHGHWEKDENCTRKWVTIDSPSAATSAAPGKGEIQFRGVVVKLSTFRKLVEERGGFDECSATKQWASVARELGFESGKHTDITTCLKKGYREHFVREESQDLQKSPKSPNAFPKLPLKSTEKELSVEERIRQEEGMRLEQLGVKTGVAVDVRIEWPPGNAKKKWVSTFVKRVSKKKGYFEVEIDAQTDESGRSMRFYAGEVDKVWRLSAAGAGGGSAAKGSTCKQEASIEVADHSGEGPYVGARIEVLFDVDGKQDWYGGKITSKEKQAGRWLVRFDDGDEETIVWPDPKGEVRIVSAKKKRRAEKECKADTKECKPDTASKGNKVGRPSKMVHLRTGDLCRVLFDDGIKYLGVVTGKDAENGESIIVFEDGEEHRVVLPDPDVFEATIDDALAELEKAQGDTQTPWWCAHPIVHPFEDGEFDMEVPEHWSRVLIRPPVKPQRSSRSRQKAKQTASSNPVEGPKADVSGDQEMAEVAGESVNEAETGRWYAERKRTGKKQTKGSEDACGDEAAKLKKKDAIDVDVQGQLSETQKKKKEEKKRDRRDKHRDRAQEKKARQDREVSSRAQNQYFYELEALLLQETPEEMLEDDDITDFVDAMSIFMPQTESLNSKDFCLVCGSSPNKDEVLYCRDCGDCFHTYCAMDTRARKIPKEKRHMWRCPACRICEVCQGEENWENMIICDGCDRGFHTYCLKPQMKEIPTEGWKCDDCVHCVSCGAKHSGTRKDIWRKDCTLCIPCFQLYEKKSYCPICKIVWRKEEKDAKAVMCDTCNKWVHPLCGGIDDAKYREMQGEDAGEWNCPKCTGEIEASDDEENDKKYVLPNQNSIIQNHKQLEDFLHDRLKTVQRTCDAIERAYNIQSESADTHHVADASVNADSYMPALAESIALAKIDADDVLADKFEALKAFALEHGHPHVRQDHTELFAFVSDLRARYKSGQLSNERLEFLRSLGFCFDGTQAQQLRALFELQQGRSKESNPSSSKADQDAGGNSAAATKTPCLHDNSEEALRQSELTPARSDSESMSVPHRQTQHAQANAEGVESAHLDARSIDMNHCADIVATPSAHQTWTATLETGAANDTNQEAEAASSSTTTNEVPLKDMSNDVTQAALPAHANHGASKGAHFLDNDNDVVQDLNSEESKGAVSSSTPAEDHPPKMNSEIHTPKSCTKIAAEESGAVKMEKPIEVKEFEVAARQMTVEERSEKLSGLLRLKKDMVKLEKAVDKHKYKELIPFFNDVMKLLNDDDRCIIFKELQRVRDAAIEAMPDAAKRSSFTGQALRQPLIVKSERYWAKQDQLAGAGAPGSTATFNWQAMLPYMDEFAKIDSRVSMATHQQHAPDYQRLGCAAKRRALLHASSGGSFVHSAYGAGLPERFATGVGSAPLHGSQLLTMMSQFYAKIKPFVQHQPEAHSRLSQHFFQADWSSTTIDELRHFVENTFGQNPYIMKCYHEVFPKSTPAPLADYHAEEADATPAATPTPKAAKPQQEHAAWFCAEVRRVYGVASTTYKGFIQTMNNYAQKDKDTLGTIRAIKNLFADNPSLIVHFAQFVPPSFKKYCVVEKTAAEKVAAVKKRTADGGPSCGAAAGMQLAASPQPNTTSVSASFASPDASDAGGWGGGSSAQYATAAGGVGMQSVAGHHSLSQLLQHRQQLQQQQQEQQQQFCYHNKYQQHILQSTGPESKKRKASDGESIKSSEGFVGGHSLSLMNQHYQQQQQQQQQQQSLMQQLRQEMHVSQHQPATTQQQLLQQHTLQQLLKDPNMAQTLQQLQLAIAAAGSAGNVQPMHLPALSSHLQTSAGNAAQNSGQASGQQHPSLGQSAPQQTTLAGLLNLLHPPATQTQMPAALFGHLGPTVESSSAAMLTRPTGSPGRSNGSILQHSDSTMTAQAGLASMGSMPALATSPYAQTLASPGAGAGTASVYSQQAFSQSSLGRNIPQMDGDFLSGEWDEDLEHDALPLPQLDGADGEEEGEEEGDDLIPPVPDDFDGDVDRYADCGADLNEQDAADVAHAQEEQMELDGQEASGSTSTLDPSAAQARGIGKRVSKPKEFGNFLTDADMEKLESRSAKSSVHGVVGKVGSGGGGSAAKQQRCAPWGQEKMKKMIERAAELPEGQVLTISGHSVTRGQLLAALQEKGMDNGNVVWVHVAVLLGIDVKKCHNYSTKLQQLLDPTLSKENFREWKGRERTEWKVRQEEAERKSHPSVSVRSKPKANKKKTTAGKVMPASRKPKAPMFINRMAQTQILATEKDACTVRHAEEGSYITLKLLTGARQREREDYDHFLPKNAKAMVPREGGLLAENLGVRKAAALAQRLWVQTIFESVERSNALQERLKRQRIAKQINVEGWDLSRLGRLIEAAAVGQGLLYWSQLRLWHSNLRPERIAELGVLSDDKERVLRRSLGGVYRDINKDPRICTLCRIVGDAGVQGRLLYVEVNAWAHVNCLCWSKGVYETTLQKNIGRIGMLCNVHDVLRKARTSLCDFCGCPGATVVCTAPGCCAVAHFGCAVLNRWSFYSENRAFCDCCTESPAAEACGGSKDVWAPMHLYKLTSRHLRVMPRTKPKLLESFVRESERSKKGASSKKRKVQAGAGDGQQLMPGLYQQKNAARDGDTGMHPCSAPRGEPERSRAEMSLQQQSSAGDMRAAHAHAHASSHAASAAHPHPHPHASSADSGAPTQDGVGTAPTPTAPTRTAAVSLTAAAGVHAHGAQTNPPHPAVASDADIRKTQSTLEDIGDAAADGGRAAVAQNGVKDAKRCWTIHVDNITGKTYYHNHTSKESVWTTPPELLGTTPEKLGCVPGSPMQHKPGKSVALGANGSTVSAGAGEGSSSKEPICRLRAAIATGQLDDYTLKKMYAIHQLLKLCERNKSARITEAKLPEDNCLLGWAAVVVTDEAAFAKELARVVEANEGGIWPACHGGEHTEAESMLSEILSRIRVYPQGSLRRWQFVKDAVEAGQEAAAQAEALSGGAGAAVHRGAAAAGATQMQPEVACEGEKLADLALTGGMIDAADTMQQRHLLPHHQQQQQQPHEAQGQSKPVPSKSAREIVLGKAAEAAAAEAVQRQRDEALNREQWDAYENNLLSNIAEGMQQGTTMARIGSLTVRRLGTIKVDDDRYHSELAIYPIGYMSNRVCFAPGEIQTKSGMPCRRAVYKCQILMGEHGGHPLFQVTVENEVFYGSSASEAWERATRRPLRERKKLKVHANEGQCDNVTEMFMACSYAIDGDYMFGVTVGPIARVLEALKESTLLFNYHARFQIWGKDYVRPNLAGCARAEPFKRRKKMSTAKTLRSAEPVCVGGTNEDEPEKEIRNRKDLKKLYERLRTDPRTVVQRSPIHNLGLFCTKDIDKHDMVIEYVGELVRPTVGDIRDELALEKGKSTYMFRIDEDYIVDAMFKGNASRFMNHSCEPNCYCQVVTVDGVKHIILFAKRPLVKGEEIMYDYKLPIEEIKIICHCGARNCRGYMN